MGLFDFLEGSQQQQQYQEAWNAPHEAKLSHELVAGAASFAAVRAYEEHQKAQGKPANHALALELIAGFAGAEVDKLAETKGMDFVDREKAKHAAMEQAKEHLHQAGEYNGEPGYQREGYGQNYYGGGYQQGPPGGGYGGPPGGGYGGPPGGGYGGPPGGYGGGYQQGPPGGGYGGGYEALLPNYDEKHQLFSHDQQQQQKQRSWPTAARSVILLLALVSTACLYFPQALSSWNSSQCTNCHANLSSREGLDQWIEKETPIAIYGIFDNIGPGAGALPGLVIASPSTSAPNYFYTWTRDSALTFSTLLTRLTLDSPLVDRPDNSMGPLMREYVSAQESLQKLTNPSGSFLDGGLGEPKYEVDGTPFKGSWGRPQRDGPALRALLLTRYAEFLLARNRPNDRTYITSHLFKTNILMTEGSVIKNDLEFVAHNWNTEDSFDLWEEKQGYHFFTLLAMLRSMESGAALGYALNDPLASKFYLLQAEGIHAKLNKFWNAKKGYIEAMLDPEKRGRNGLDAAVLLAVNAVHQEEKGHEENDFGVANDKVLATLKAFVDSFRGLYSINKGMSFDGAVAVGRYPEDIYDGVGTSKGNPWYLCTLSVSQTIYNALIHFKKTGRISITPISLSFWSEFTRSKLEPDTELKKGDRLYDEVIKNAEKRASGFIKVVQTYADQNGLLSEQFGKDDGLPRGAKNLTWSYAAFVEATGARKNFQTLLY